MELSLTDYMRAAFPCLLIDSTDYGTALQQIREAFRARATYIPREEHRTMVLALWSITKGLIGYPIFGNKEDIRDEDVLFEHPNASFSAALESLDTVPIGNMVLVLTNPRTYIQREARNIQKVIDSAERAKERFSHIVLLGPGVELPPELELIVQNVDIPLPKVDELVDICLSRVVLANQKRSNLKFPKHSEALPLAKLKKKLFTLNEEVLTAAAKAACGLDRYAAENAFSLSQIKAEKLDPKIIHEFKKEAIQASEVLELIENDETMDNLGGFDRLKKWLSSRSQAYTDEAKEFGVVPPKGILLVGVPGSGKSLAAKAAASALGLPLLRFDMSRIFDRWVGSSEHKMRTALQVAEAVAPCLLWLDEIEKSIAGASSDGDSGVSARVLSQFLTWRQETKADIFVACTCNDVHRIPPEFYRPGRIDGIFATSLPNHDERKEIFSIHLRKRGKAADLESIDLDAVAKACVGYTGAEIELAVGDSIFHAFNKGARPVTSKGLIRALGRIKPQSVRNKEQVRSILTWAKERAISVSSKKEKQTDHERKLYGD